jgi:hypothetical protein
MRRLADQRFLAQNGGQGALGGAALSLPRHVDGGGQGRQRERLETGFDAGLLTSGLAVAAQRVVELGGLALGWSGASSASRRRASSRCS